MSQRFIYPSLMDIGATATNIKSDIERQNSSSVDEERKGCDNVGLEVYNEFVGVSNRELVNLENAAVNIDNSNDVIIGPVTQFNVNGNVTIYQGNDGQPIGIKDRSEIPNSSCEGCILKLYKVYIKFYPDVKKILSRLLMSTILTSCALCLYLGVVSENKIQRKLPYDTSIYKKLGNYSIYYIDQWGEENGIEFDVNPLPVGLVIIGDTQTKTCDNFDDCSKILKSYQQYEIISLGYKNICENFLISTDGTIYVGRGWDVRNCYDRLSIEISFIGNFNKHKMSKDMITSLLLLLNQGQKLYKLPNDYIIIALNQTIDTSSPGIHVYEVIKNMCHFSNINLKSRFSYYFFSFIYDVTKFFNNIFSTTICLQTFSL